MIQDDARKGGISQNKEHTWLHEQNAALLHCLQRIRGDLAGLVRHQRPVLARLDVARVGSVVCKDGVDGCSACKREYAPLNHFSSFEEWSLPWVAI